MKIYFATWTEENQRWSLDKKKARRRLLSYYFIKDEAANYLKRYFKGRLREDVDNKSGSNDR